jgi:glutamyl-tRNA synthetase
MAPGPTGAFHIGRTRAAIVNWIFARHHGGTFVLRIEDTDVQRSKPEHLQSILDSLRWLGLTWDEGPEIGGPYAPYFQMGRLDSYSEYCSRLLDSGHAYKCYCTAEELDELRRQAEVDRRPFRYPGTCRNLTPEEQAEREARGLKAAIRLLVPDEGETSWDDLILGQISYRNDEIGDFVIQRSSGIPLYNFTVTIDDLTMQISHVIRGQDHISNTPKQILIYQALGIETPTFGHVPLMVSSEGAKIGARFGASAVVGLADAGYLPEAVFNYMATLGITYEADREIYSRDEIINLFDIGHVSHSPAVFDAEKLDWMNGVYIRNLSLDDFVSRSLPFLQADGLVSATPSDSEIEQATRALALEQERVRTLAETPDAVRFFLTDHVDYDPALLVVKKSSVEDARRVLTSAIEVCAGCDFTSDALEHAFRNLAETLGLKTGIVFGTIRVAVTGRTAAPPLFATLEVLGRERVLQRLEAARREMSHWGEAAPVQ